MRGLEGVVLWDFEVVVVAVWAVYCCWKKYYSKAVINLQIRDWELWSNTPLRIPHCPSSQLWWSALYQRGNGSTQQSNRSTPVLMGAILVDYLLHAKNSGKYDLPSELYLPAHCDFRALEDYKKGRQASKYRFSLTCSL